MHRGRDIIIGFALSNKSLFFTRGAPLVEDHQLLCDSMFFRDPFVAIQLLSSPSLDFLRPGLICRTPKVPFSFPLLPFVRVSFNLLLFLSPLSPLVVHHPRSFSLLSYVSSVISTSASRGNSLSACRVPSHPLAPSNDVSRRLSLFFRVWQPFVPHPSSHPPVLLSLGTCPIPATNFDHKVSTI